MLDVVWDMETDDPDDFLTLLWLAGHPQINLKAVTLLPGSPQQVGLVRHALSDWFKLDIPIGAHNPTAPKSRVSQWHYAAYGEIAPSWDAQPASEVLRAECDAQTTLLTGAALTNLRTAIRQQPDFGAGRLIAQGGFAGEGVVPAALQMEKFRGQVTCPTHNLMADRKAAELVANHAGFSQRYFVSKNVCHRVIYDEAMHRVVEQFKDSCLALSLIWQGMTHYLQINPAGKMLHDPLAACCALDLSIGTWREVNLFREGSNWGARPAPGSGTWIIIDYDHEKFFRTFLSVAG